ncbi:hypothetical protein SLA2020_428990 [Shorea laevis]
MAASTLLYLREHVGALDDDALAGGRGGSAADNGFRSSEIGGFTVRPPAMFLSRPRSFSLLRSLYPCC